MSSREEFEAWFKYNYSWFIGQGSPQHGLERFNEHGLPGYAREIAHHDWRVWQASRENESDILSALQAITNSGPNEIPINEAFEMAHRAIERATGGNV